MWTIFSTVLKSRPNREKSSNLVALIKPKMSVFARNTFKDIASWVVQNVSLPISIFSCFKIANPGLFCLFLSFLHDTNQI